jgi:predicted HicB family RNase H-like nuclease
MTRRKRGRPPLDPGTPTSSLTLPLSSSLHDRLCKKALERGLSVNELARRAIERDLEPVNKPTENSSVTRPGRY